MMDVSDILRQLRRAGEALRTIGDPLSFARVFTELMGDLFALLRDLPGDPDAIDADALAYRQLATALDATTTDLSKTASTGVPSVWQGKAADEALTALTSTRQLTEAAAPAMRYVATLYEDYADTLRALSKDLRGYREDLHEVARDLYDPFDLPSNIRKAIDAVAGAIAVFDKLNAAIARLNRGLGDVIGKARAGAVRSPYVSAFDAVALATAGVSGLARLDNGILTTAQLQAIADKMGALSDADRARLQGLLDAAGSEAERAYLLKALAAGHSVTEIEAFGKVIHGKSPAWLDQQLGLVDSADSGNVYVNGAMLEQRGDTTCGSTAIMVARAMNDPLYALWLTTDDKGVPLSDDAFRDRIKAEQDRIHDATNTIWPPALGTTPWGLSDEMNVHAESFGTSYDWHLQGSGPLNEAVSAVDAGHKVPVLIGGDLYPEHYVLLVGHEGDELIFYNPWGRMTRMKESDFLNGDMSALSFGNLYAVVTPS